jgi:hypothetical protein
MPIIFCLIWFIVPIPLPFFYRSRSVAVTALLVDIQTLLPTITFQGRINCNDFSCGPDTLIITTTYLAQGIGIGQNTFGESTTTTMFSTLTRIVSGARCCVGSGMGSEI